MNAPMGTAATIESAVTALGLGPLTESLIARHIAPLFSRVLARNADQIYLANHSLGRPLDATASDIAAALALWQTRLGDAWDEWSAEMSAYRTRLARLLNAPRADCVVPRTSAGQGLRAILNSYDTVPRVVATRGEFDSIDVILRQYASRGRIRLHLVEPQADGMFAAEDLFAALRGGADLVVLSQVMFTTSQVLPELAASIQAAHQAGARVLLDVYHALGVLPVDIAALDADFAIGGSYKYLRGGPGAGYLYLHPRHLDGSMSTLDAGWFAKRDRFGYQRPDPIEWAQGGDAWLEGTPPVLTWYQARAGQLFTLAIGVERLRVYSLEQQRRLVSLLTSRGLEASGATLDRGAFVVIRLAQAGAARRCADELGARGVAVDARGPWLRLCPDLLNTTEELQRAAQAVSNVIASLR
jgi:kynureninase